MKWWASLVFLFSFIFYIFTLSPSVAWLDSGELTTAAHVLGIPHPTGYPLYTMLAKLFTLIPIGSIAWRINLMSALFGALSVMLLYLIVNQLTKHDTSALISAVALAVSPSFWDVSTMAEVYSMHIFFLLLNIWLLLKYQKGDKMFLYLFALSFGLSMAHHVTSVLFVPGYLYLILKSKKINMRAILICLLLFSAGLLPYLYLPIRSSADPVLDWGDPVNARNFISHVTAQRYSDYVPQTDSNQVHKIIMWHFPFLWPLVLFGLYRSRYWKFLLLLLVPFIFFNIGYKIMDISYYIPIFVIAWFGLGIGAKHVMQMLKGTERLIAGLFIGIVLLYGLTFIDLDRSKDFSARDYAIAIMSDLPTDSIVLNNQNEYGPLLYMKFVEKYRPDIDIMQITCLLDEGCKTELLDGHYIMASPNVDLSVPVTDEHLRQFVSEVAPRRVYITDPYNAPNPNDRSTWVLHPVTDKFI